MNKENIKKLLAEGKVADAMDYLLEAMEGNGELETKDVYPEDEGQHSEEMEEVKVENDDIYPAEEHKEAEEVKEVVVESATLDEMFDFFGTLESEEEIENIVENVLNEEEYENFMVNLEEGFGNWVRRTFNGDNAAIKDYIKYKKKYEAHGAKESSKNVKVAGKEFRKADKAYNKGLKQYLKQVKRDNKGYDKDQMKQVLDRERENYNKKAGKSLYDTRTAAETKHNSLKTKHDDNYTKDAYKKQIKDLKAKSDQKYLERRQNIKKNRMESKAEVLKKKGLLENANDFELLSWLNENEYEPDLENLSILKEMLEELNNVATEDKTPETMEQKLDNNDIYPTEEHKEAEEVKEVVVEDTLEGSDPEVEKAEEKFGEEPKEAPVGEISEEPKEEESHEEEAISPEVKDVADEVTELVNEPVAGLEEGFDALSALISQINESLDATEDREPKELDSEVETKEVYPANEHKEVSGEEVENISKEEAPEIKSGDVEEEKVELPEDEHKEAEEVKEVVVESEQVAAGPELKEPKELENEATEEREPKELDSEVETKEVYPAEEHKEVKDVVEVVVEAAKLCGENGVPATLENITRFAKTLFESESVALNVGKPEEKEYDADADIESSEMNGNKEEFEKYEDIQGEGAEAAKGEEAVVEPADLHESVKYTSLREACLLDEDYFVTDSYTIQTAEEKYNKLTEQVALLMAREAMDPLYDELLQTSFKAQRLQEACCKKYRNKAKQQVNENIVPERLDEEGLINFLNELASNPEALNEGKVGNFFVKIAIKFLGRKSLDKILTSTKQKLSGKELSNKGESLLEKVEAALRSNDKSEKRAVIRNFLDMADEKTLANADAKLKNYAKRNKTLKEEITFDELVSLLEDDTVYGSYEDAKKAADAASGIKFTQTIGAHNAAINAATSGLGATFLGLAGPQAFIVGLIIGIIGTVIVTLIIKHVKSTNY